MPLVLPVPSEQTVLLNLPVSDDPDQQEYVKVRTATNAEQMTISEFVARRESHTYDKDGRMTYKSDFSLPAIRRLQAYTVLAGCSLMKADQNDPENVEKFSPLFNFQRVGGKMRVMGTEDDFNKAWGDLPMSWADAIIVAILKVNPWWNPDAGE